MECDRPEIGSINVKTGRPGIERLRGGKIGPDRICRRGTEPEIRIEKTAGPLHFAPSKAVKLIF